MSDPATPRPQLVPAYIAGLAVVGWPLAFVLALGADGPPSWQAGVLAAAVLVTGFVPLRLQRGGHSHGITTDEAVLVALLALGAGPWAGLLLGGAVTVGHLLIGARPTKVLFNGSQVALAASVAAVVFGALGSPTQLLSFGWFVSLTAALTVQAVLGIAAMTGLFVLLEGRGPRAIAAESSGLVAAGTAGNLLFGIVLAFLVATDDRMITIGVGLMLAVQLGYRGYVRIVNDRARTQQLQDTTRALVEVAGDADRLHEVLVALTSLFGGGRADMLIELPEGRRHLAATSSGRLEDVEPEAAALEALRTGGRVQRTGTDDGTLSAIAVPIVYEGQVMGSLAILDRRGLEPWSEIDLGLLASLAHEAAVTLRTIDLFDEVRRERGRYADESRKLTDVVNATSDGIVTLGLDGTVTVWNEAMSHITGTGYDEAIGRPWFGVLRLRDAEGRELVDRQRNVITTVLGGVAVTSVDLQVLRRDGTWRWLRCALNPVVSGDEGATGAVLVARDVTSQLELDQLKSDFIATVSHELRTPLTPLLGFVETLDRHGAALSDEHRGQALGAMRTQLHRLGKLVDDLLLSAESERGLQTAEPTDVDLGEVVQRELDRFDAAQRSRVTGATDEPVRVLGDEQAISRIVHELVGNALKHTSNVVEWRAYRGADAVVIAVTDEGPGIARADQARIFDRFSRLGDHLHRTQGPGLGLPIARALAERAGGTLEVDSGVDRGSTFVLRLPATSAAEPREPNAVAGLRAVG